MSRRGGNDLWTGGSSGNRCYNHSDHRNAGAIALDSVFPGAGNPHFFPEQLEEGLEPWDVKDVSRGWTNEPNHIEDVTASFRTKSSPKSSEFST